MPILRSPCCSPTLLVAAIAWNPADGDLVLLAAERVRPRSRRDRRSATLPAKARGQVFVEVDDESDIASSQRPGRVCVTWLRRDRGQQLQCRRRRAGSAEMLPVEFDREHRVYAWISGDRAAQLLTNA